MIERIKRQKGYTYRARVALPNKQRVSKTFSKKVDAQKWERQMLYQIQTGTIHGNKLNSKITFSQLVGEWYHSRIKPFRSPRTIKAYQGSIRTHLLPHLGDVLIRKIERFHCDSVVSQMKTSGYAPKTINKVSSLFKQILKYAVEEGHLSVNPLSKYPTLKVPPKEDVFLTQKEIQQLLVKNNQHWIFPVLVLAVNTGMRRGELLGLCWDRVNFESGFIEVTRNQTREGLQETTKSNKRRCVPMNTTVRNLLMDLMKQQSSKYVLTDAKGKPLDVGHFTYRHFKTALKTARLRDIRFHDLRHNYASHFMMNGGNIFDLQKILGHSDMKMTSRYAHLSPDHLKEASNLVSFNVLETESPQKVHKLKSL